MNRLAFALAVILVILALVLGDWGSAVLGAAVFGYQARKWEEPENERMTVDQLCDDLCRKDEV